MHQIQVLEFKLSITTMLNLHMFKEEGLQSLSQTVESMGSDGQQNHSPISSEIAGIIPEIPSMQNKAKSLSLSPYVYISF